jgi:hypothetical protein
MRRDVDDEDSKEQHASLAQAMMAAHLLVLQQPYI